MNDSQPNEARNQTVADEARRAFLMKAGTMVVTAPAVAILLRASAASAWGTNPYAIRLDRTITIHGDKKIELARYLQDFWRGIKASFFHP